MSEYTPKKKKQKTLAKRPPLAPTKKSNHARQDDDDEEESRWDQEEMCVTSCRGVQHRDNHDMTTGVDTTIDTIAPWNSPYVHNKTTQEDPRRCHLQPEDRMPSLDGLELLEMMSFDEYDNYQEGDDDQSLCYSVVSEVS